MAVRSNYRMALDAGIGAVPLEYGGRQGIVALRAADHELSAYEHRPILKMMQPLVRLARVEPDINFGGRTSELVRRFDTGMASIFVDTNRDEAIGYARLKNRLTDQDRQKLGISAPEIVYEMGTVVLARGYRESGLAGVLIGDLLDIYRGRGDSERTLVVATMKQVGTELAFRGAFYANGYSNMQFQNHLQFSEIARLTCTCNPPFGSGMHIEPSNVCFARIGNGYEVTAALKMLNEGTLPRNEKGKPLPSALDGMCVLFVSDAGMAYRVNSNLESRRGDGGAGTPVNMSPRR